MTNSNVTLRPYLERFLALCDEIQELASMCMSAVQVRSPPTLSLGRHRKRVRAVFTRPHVAELVLDLAGYTSERNLSELSLLEPSCGHGAFLLPAVGRLLVAAERSGCSMSAMEDAIVAFDIDQEHLDRTREVLFDLLAARGVGEGVARRLVEKWVRHGDFLLAPIDRNFDVVVGNPPYVRLEEIPGHLLSYYRQRYRTLCDRADIYVGFIERGLSLLTPRGTLAFICPDRWITNRYGGALRELVSKHYGVRCYVDLNKTSPFESDVAAYPSIVVLSPGKSESVPVVALETASPLECGAVKNALAGKAVPPGVGISVYPRWFEGGAPWVLTPTAHMETLRFLERTFSSIEATAKVGIGAATGADSVYVVDRDVDIEPERLVPLVMRDDIEAGRIKDSGRFLINTFDDSGRAVELDQYPRLRRYLHAREDQVRRRYVARKSPNFWFRTIDRVDPMLVQTPKLLIPDIAGANEVCLDEGRFYPHHNLYFVTSDQWDLEVLGGLLSSKVALFFVWSYAVKMRGGYLRFQAQYLRRIRLPDPAALSENLAIELKRAFRERAFSRLDSLALQAYGLRELPPFDFVDTRA